MGWGLLGRDGEVLHERGDVGVAEPGAGSAPCGREVVLNVLEQLLEHVATGTMTPGTAVGAEDTGSLSPASNRRAMLCRDSRA